MQDLYIFLFPNHHRSTGHLNRQVVTVGCNDRGRAFRQVGRKGRAGHDVVEQDVSEDSNFLGRRESVQVNASGREGVVTFKPPPLKLLMKENTESFT